jgi:benzylsuccinate CoA-transferase BbsF subunit
VPIADWQDLLDDPQLAARGHFERMQHAVLGECTYQHNGFRLSDAPARYERPAPVLGEHNEQVLRELLGYSAADAARLLAGGGVE